MITTDTHTLQDGCDEIETWIVEWTIMWMWFWGIALWGVTVWIFLKKKYETIAKLKY